MLRIGWLLLAVVLAWPVAAFSCDANYGRELYGGWIDADGDCQDTRQEVLIAESEIPVATTRDGCRVLSGRWRDPYSGEVFTDPGDLDVDHMVPLRNAHYSGGWRWDRARRVAYANELENPQHLIAVSARLNRQKGARGPEEWRPPNPAYSCRYAHDWFQIKQRHDLTFTAAEVLALADMVIDCVGVDE